MHLHYTKPFLCKLFNFWRILSRKAILEKTQKISAKRDFHTHSKFAVSLKLQFLLTKNLFTLKWRWSIHTNIKLLVHFQMEMMGKQVMLGFLSGRNSSYSCILGSDGSCYLNPVQVHVVAFSVDAVYLPSLLECKQIFIWKCEKSKIF